MVFVLKPLTRSQQVGDNVQEEYKHKSRLVICGNFASWGEHSTTTTNLDAPLLRLMLSLECWKETTWSSIDITSAFLNADIHDEPTEPATSPRETETPYQRVNFDFLPDSLVHWKNPNVPDQVDPQ